LRKKTDQMEAGPQKTNHKFHYASFREDKRP